MGYATYKATQKTIEAASRANGTDAATARENGLVAGVVTGGGATAATLNPIDAVAIGIDAYIEGNRIRDMRQKAVKVVAIIGLALSAVVTTGQPVQANDGDAIACEQAGGNYVSGRCEKASPPTFDLFGKLVIAALLLTAVGVASGGSSK